MENEKIKKSGFSFTEMEEKLQQSTPAFILYTIAVFILMGIACIAVFTYMNKGYEEVLVPNVVGKNLTKALLEMQEKELYPRLQLRYSEMPGEAGQVLSQDPKSGTIVKAGRRVTLVVSRGVMVDHVGNYVGMNLDTLKTTLDTLYGGSDMPSLYIENPVFKIDDAPVGTILEQDPPEGTPISQPVALSLVVSRGPSKPVVKVPELKGKAIADVLSEIGKINLIFDFTGHVAEAGEIPGTVSSVQEFESGEVPEYSHVAVDFAFAPIGTEFSGDTVVENKNKGKTENEIAESMKKNTDGFSQGIFSTEIAKYPFAVPVKLDAIPQEGGSYTVAAFNHVGGKITVPYAVPHGTVLVFSVINHEKERLTIQ